MPLEESPSLDQYKQGFQLDNRKPQNTRRVAWIIIAILSFISISLATFIFINNQSFEKYAGTGTVTGLVVGERNQPIEAKVLILGTEIEGESDIEGFFEINEVPTGEQSVVVLYQGIGWENSITIISGQVTNIGRIKVIPTSEPNK